MKKIYYIDFCCWEVVAENPTDAYFKALGMMAEGKMPEICSTDQTSDDVPEGDVAGNFEWVDAGWCKERIKELEGE